MRRMEVEGVRLMMILSLPGMAMRKWKSFVCSIAVLCVLGCSSHVLTEPLRPHPEVSWSAPLSEALSRSGTNRIELERALRSAPAAQQEGMRFLVENMPEVDLKTLGSTYLLENVALAYTAYEKAPWKSQVPKRIFLNDVLPYSCLTEDRDGMRRFLRDAASPLVLDCNTPAEAAHRLNQVLFSRLNAHYSLAGTRPDQSVKETLASGKATCIGLSVLLVGACRAVGIPARLAGIPLWPDLRGTHEWVEIWDGDWHFLGADEPDSEGLNHAWFNEDASKAIGDVPQHAIYATSFEKTGLSFPLIWAPNVRWVNAVNVTDRYRTAWPPSAKKPGRLIVKTLDRHGRRRAANITVHVSGSARSYAGSTPDESADPIIDLSFSIPRIIPASRYVIRAEFKGTVQVLEIKAGAAPEDVAIISFP